MFASNPPPTTPHSKASPSKASISKSSFSKTSRSRQKSSSQKIRVLSNNPVDIRLRDLVAEACRHPAKSYGRRSALNQLVTEAQACSRFYRGQGAKQEHYEEARSMAWLWVCRNIDRYDPSKAEVLTWINFRLTNDLKTVQIKEWKEQDRFVSPVAYEDGGHAVLVIELQPAPANHQSYWQQFESWLLEHEAEFLRIHVIDQPDVNCLALFQLRILQGQTFPAIAKQLKSPTSTVTTFWYKQCQPKLHDFLDNLL